MSKFDSKAVYEYMVYDLSHIWYTRYYTPKVIEKSLNDFGKDGWVLCTKNSNELIFCRVINVEDTESVSQ